jgi:hypothetical protein
MARPKKIDTLSVAELKALISDKRGRLAQLRKERNKLIKKLAVVERQMERAGGEVTGKRVGGIRPRNDKSLVSVIEEVLAKGKQMRVPDIAKAVLDTGYKTSSPKFSAIVNQALIKDKRFHAVDRGIYATKK